MKGFGDLYKSKKKNKTTKPSKEKIFNLAIQFHLKGNISEAAKYYQYFISQGFNDQRVFSNYGTILQSLGKLQEAELLIRKAIKLKPDYAIAHSNLGNVLRDLGKLQEAELCIRKAIELKPDFADAYSNLGSVLKDLGKLEEAELFLRKAIELKPDFADAYSNLGSVLKVLGKLQEAELFIRKAIELKPDFANAYSNLGSVLKDLGKLEEAELFIRKAIELKPDFANAYSNLGSVLKDLGKLEEAELFFRKAIELKPDFADAYSNLGSVLKVLGKLEEAELLIRKAIELKPDLAEAHLNLGTIFSKLGKLQEAELSTLKAIELNPFFAEAHLNLATIFSKLGKLQEAELSTRKAIELKPDLAEAYLNLGTIFSKLGKLQEAELSTRKAIELKPDLAEAYSNLGSILIDLGKLNELLLLSKSTLKSKTIDQEYKLIAKLRIAIANLLRKDFSATLLYLNKIKELINQGVVDKIKSEESKKYLCAYFEFISLLYPLLEKKNEQPDVDLIPHLGESHCLSFAHQTLSISSKLNQIQPVLITGGKAWHFANNQNNQWKSALTQQIKNHTYSDKVFISFGEIDCRKDEGILNYSIKYDKDIAEVCEETIKGYVNYMEEILSPNYSERYYFGVAAPTRGKKLLDDIDVKRIKMVRLYNSILKKEVLSRSSNFLDVYKLTSNKDGINNNIHMCDDYHLSPKCLSILFMNYLYKS